MADSSTSLAPTKKKIPMPPEKLEKLKNLPQASEKQEVHELPVWVKIALTRREINNLTYAEAAKELKHGKHSLSDYARSPAGIKWRETIASLAEDPVALSKTVLAEASTDVTLDRFMIFDAAKASGDWNLADRIAKDLQDRMGIVAKKQETGAISLKINFGGANFDAPIVEADWEES